MSTEQLSWYIVNAFSGHENAVKRSLEERIEAASLEDCFEEILVPSEKVTTQRGKRKVTQTKKFFPGYVFVHMRLTEEAWHLVKNTPKVSGFLGGKKPRPVSQQEIDRMLGKTTESQVEVQHEDVNYEVGQNVRVKQGAFVNFTGKIEEVNGDKRKIKLSVSIFGRPTKVEVDFTEVELA